MSVDIRKLSPSELCRLVNSTPIGPVMTHRVLDRHRVLAGLRIGDGRKIDILRYAAWLVDTRHGTGRTTDAKVDPYLKIKQDSHRRVIEASLASRDIKKTYPDRGNLALRGTCERDFRLFCESYFPEAFYFKWSDDHLRAIARMEAATLEGGLFALAMPRGSGKSALARAAVLWALLYGHRRFVCLIAATQELAERLLEQIKISLTLSERLTADFRQVCHPIASLEGSGRKAPGQLFGQEPTRIIWESDRLTFPTMPDWACDGVNVSGSTITVAGLTSALRGQSCTLADGTILRPELVILDDPQTREAAMSPSQSATRAAIVRGDVLGMAGPGKRIAAIMPCTVIRDGDMASELLDRKKSPEWHGQRTKMVYAWPKNTDLWDKYKQIREGCQQAEQPTVPATEFYAANRAAMDEGAVIAWPERKYPDELSGLQHAWNLRIEHKDPAFFAEFQNDPLPEVESRPDDLTPDQICAKVNRHRRGVVPIACNHVTAFIDVQASLLYYVVAAWADDFSGAIIDYGTYPDQKKAYFILRDAGTTLAKAHKGAGLEGRIYAGLETLTTTLLGRTWSREDGADLKIERCLIDAGWATDTILQFSCQSAHAAIITPSHGKFVGPGSKPFREYTKHPGDRIGSHWRVPAAKGHGTVRHVLIDTNYWKSFIHARLAVAMGDRGCLSLWGDKPEVHRMLADQLTAEICRPQFDKRADRWLDVWQHRPERPDNHFLDCCVGAAVAASMQGVELPEAKTAAIAPKATRVSFAELQKRQRA